MIRRDTFGGIEWSYFPPKQIHLSGTPESIREDYMLQKSNITYQSFMNKTNATILGVFDDHDYGTNNGDETFPYKEESGLAFLDFIGDAATSGFMYERAKSGFGVYGVKVFDFSREDGNYLLTDDEAGLDADLPAALMKNENTNEESIESSSKKVAIFMLDVRTNKTPWHPGYQSWIPDYEGDFLGEKQWEWFEKSIQNSDASINIIVNGLQVHSYRFHSANSAELWSSFPSSRQRLYDTILQKNVKSPIIISGDVHMSSFMRKDCFKTNELDQSDVQSRPIVEFTTSGMTHSWGSCFACSSSLHENRWKYLLCNLFGRSFMTLVYKLIPTPDLIVATKDDQLNDNFVNGGADKAKIGQQYSLEKNFGLLEIDWKQRMLKISAVGSDVNAPPLLGASFSFDQLSGSQKIPGSMNVTEFEMHENLKLFMDGNLTNGEYTCYNHRSPPHTSQAIFGIVGLATYFFSIFVLPHVLLVIGIKKALFRK